MKTSNSKYLIYALTAGLAICGGANTNIAEAASSTARQTVTITVPPIRALYVDEEETIVAIFSNVPAIANEKLQVFKGRVEIAVSDQVEHQYKKLLPIVDWSSIGWVYQQRDSETKSVKRAGLGKNRLEKLTAIWIKPFTSILPRNLVFGLSEYLQSSRN